MVVQMIMILCGLCDMFESYYKVMIIDEVIIVVVEFLDCYIIGCFMFDKVIDLIDQVVVWVKILVIVWFVDVQEFEVEVVQIKCEQDYVVVCK